MAEPSETGDLLFAYAAGALDGTARVRVEAMLDARPELRDELRWYEAVCDGMIDKLPAPRALPSFEQFAKRIRRKDPSSKGGWLAWLKPVAAALLVMQAVAIGVLLNERREAEVYRSVAPVGGQGKQVVFVIAFNPETPESKVRALLLKAGATIVDGPKQMGDYRVAVPVNRAQYAKQLFEDSGITEYVRSE
jgi:anti-sigma factor RsiW